MPSLTARVRHSPLYLDLINYQCMSEIGENYDAIANIYDEKIHSGYREQIQDSIVFSVLDEVIGETGIHILDAGGGTGHYSLPYAKKGHKITILDISLKMLQVAESKADRENVSGNVETIQRDMSNTQLLDESFDFIICHLALCHVHDPKTTIGEFHRLLRKNGALSLIVENRAFFSMADAFRGNLSRALENQMKESLEIKLSGLGTLRTFRREELLSMLTEAGLKPTQIMGLRILSDYLFYQSEGPIEDLESLTQLETLLSVDDTWNRIGRFHFIIAQK